MAYYRGSFTTHRTILHVTHRINSLLAEFPAAEAAEGLRAWPMCGGSPLIAMLEGHIISYLLRCYLDGVKLDNLRQPGKAQHLRLLGYCRAFRQVGMPAGVRCSSCR